MKAPTPPGPPRPTGRGRGPPGIILKGEEIHNENSKSSNLQNAKQQMWLFENNRDGRFLSCYR